MSEQPLIAVVRVRGEVHVRHQIAETLKHLRLNEPNHCVVIQLTDIVKGMISKINDYVTYGEIDGKTLKNLLKKRGKIKGNKPLTDDFIKEKTKYDSIDSFAQALLKSETTMNDVEDLKPLFRLQPPLGGHAKVGIKKGVKVGGALGNRKEKINQLLEAMI